MDILHIVMVYYIMCTIKPDRSWRAWQWYV